MDSTRNSRFDLGDWPPTQAEEAVQLLQALFQQYPIPVALSYLENGEFIAVNDALLEVLGYGREEVIGKTAAELGLYVDTGQRESIMKALMATGSVSGEESPVRRRDGSIVICSYSARLIKTRRGLQVLGLMSDISGLKRAEERHRIILETAPDGFIINDVYGKVLEVNDSYCRMMGFTKEELLTMSIPDLEAEEEPEAIARRIGKLTERGSDRFESRHRRKDGMTIDVEVSASYVDVGGGQIVAFVRDISERKRAEHALRESELQYRTLVENIPQRIFLKDRNSVYLSCNGRYAEDMGIRPEDISGHTDFDFYPADLAEKYRADDRRVVESGSTLELEESYIWRGEERVVETLKAPVRDGWGKVVGVLGVFTDITERKQAEQAKEEIERHYRLLAENTTDVVSIFDLNMNLVWVSPSIERQTGYTAEEIKNVPVDKTMTPESIAGAVEAFNQGKHSYETGMEFVDHFEMQGEVYRKDGTTFWSDIRYQLIRDSEGKPVYVLMQGRDVTERRRVEDALRQSEARYRLIAENTSDSIWALGPDLRLTYQSPSGERIFGYTLQEWQAMGWRDFVHPDHLTMVTGLFRGFRRGRERGSQTLTVKIRHKDGRELWVEITATPIRGQEDEFGGVVGVTRDISERMRAEQQLLEYQAAVEQSADGIALADMEGRIRFVNSAWARMHGRSVAEVTGKHLSIFHTRAQMESDVIPFNRRLLEAGANRGEVWHVRKDGHEFPTFMTTTLLKGQGDRPYGLLAIMRDITEQKLAERQEHDRAIAQARAEELSESRRRLVSAQETLRRDIAGKLHGTVQSRLILLGHRLAELEARTDSETIAGELADIRQKLEELQNQHVRPISRRLFPSILRLGLCVGLEALVEEYSAELSVDLQVSRRLKAREQANRRLVPDAVKLSLYRIAQEALANIVRHAARVTNVVVKLSLSDGGLLRLTVSDDGVGFDRGSTAAGIGLALISDYAAVAGGLCSVKTMPGKGTRVRAEVPIAGPVAES
jgi:PAS domain S-box-containing protein